MMNEQWIKVLGIVIVFSMNVTSGWMFESGHNTHISILMITLLIFMILQWESAHQIIKYGRRKFPHLRSVKRRVTFTALYFFVLSFALQVINDIIIDNVLDKKPFVVDPLRVSTIVLSALMFTLTTIGMFEAVYYYSSFSKAELEKNELLRANLQSQFDSLKGQVNPHFLFNSLNSLSSLISKDAAKAECFVEEMSNVYRYLLRSNQQELITLEEEMEFIDSYIHLLVTRFGDNLHVERNISEQYLNDLLPPLTLQILVENAVKHNIISSEEPLHLSIFTTKNDRLHVVNNLQKKHREVLSGKVGLSNIIAKYKLLNQPDVEIKETEKEFVVTIPLIKASVYESFYS